MIKKNTSNVMRIKKISLIFSDGLFLNKMEKITSVRTKMLFNNIKSCYNLLDEFQVSYNKDPRYFTLLVS